MKEKSQGGYQRFGCSHELLFSKTMETTQENAKRTFLMGRISISTILALLPHHLNLEISSEYHSIL